MAAVPVMPDELEVAQALYHYITPAMKLADVPRFGTAEWVSLDEDDPRRQAAVIRAAMAHWGAALAAQQAHMEASQAIAGVEARQRRDPAFRRELFRRQDA